MALEGTLRDVSLSDIFQLILMQQRTGILTLFRGKEVVTVSFEKGKVVFSDEFQRSEQERLGAVLLKAKLITPQQLLRAVEMQKQTLQKLGFILINNGFLRQEQLKKALQMQVRETVFKLFRWEDGQFKFSQEPVAYDVNFYQPMPTDFLVMEGIRRIDEWPLIKNKIPSLEVIFDRTEAAEKRIEEAAQAPVEEDLDDILSFVDEGNMRAAPKEESHGFKLSSEEHVVFALVDGNRSVQDLIDEARLGEFETCKALFSLLSLGLVRKVGQAQAAEEEEPGRERPLFLRKAVLAVGGFLVAAAIVSVNPMGLPQMWPKAREADGRAGVVADDLSRERIKFGLLCYYLEKRSYPVALGELVREGFLRSEDILDSRGEEFTYLREKSGYSLGSTAGWDRE